MLEVQNQYLEMEETASTTKISTFRHRIAFEVLYQYPSLKTHLQHYINYNIMSDSQACFVDNTV
jgi:hypothetical protein